MQWAQYERGCSCTASLTGIANAEEYKSLLGTALDWSTLRKIESDQSDTISKEEYPGKFKDELIWPKWESYLSAIRVVNSVTLSYVV